LVERNISIPSAESLATSKSWKLLCGAGVAGVEAYAAAAAARLGVQPAGFDRVRESTSLPEVSKDCKSRDTQATLHVSSANCVITLMTGSLALTHCNTQPNMANGLRVITRYNFTSLNYVTWQW
jgi:hypothetical protein